MVEKKISNRALLVLGVNSPKMKSPFLDNIGFYYSSASF